MASPSPTVVVSVLGLSRLDGENFSSHQGIGKSCLCYRFMYPGYDDYQQDHRSLLALHEFESDVIHNDHFLYWGSTTRTYMCNGKGPSEMVRFEVLEHTVFYQDVTELPFRINCSTNSVTSFDGYMKMSLDSTLNSPGKLLYRNRDLICSHQECGSLAFSPGIGKHKRGFVVVIDVSDSGPTFERRLRLTDQMVKHLASRKEKFVVAATKRDEMYFATSLEKLSELARACKFTLIEVSAKSNVNVSEVFEIVAAKVLGKTAQGLPTHVPAYHDAALKTLSNRDNARRVFRTYLQKRVTVASELLKAIELVEEYKACAHLHGKFETDKMFACHVLTLRNEEISAYPDVADNKSMRQKFLEDYVAERTDLSPYANYLKDLIINICQKSSNEASITLPPPDPLPPAITITPFWPVTPSPYLIPLITSPSKNGWVNVNAPSSDTPKTFNAGGQKLCDNSDYKTAEETSCPLECLPPNHQCAAPLNEDMYDYPLVLGTVPLKNRPLSTTRVKSNGCSVSPPHHDPLISNSDSTTSLHRYVNIAIQANDSFSPRNDFYANWVLENNHLSGTKLHSHAEGKPYPLQHNPPTIQCSSTMGEEYDYPWVPNTVPLKNKLLPTSRIKLDGSSKSPLPRHGPFISAGETQATTSVHSYINIGMQGSNDFDACDEIYVYCKSHDKKEVNMNGMGTSNKEEHNYANTSEVAGLNLGPVVASQQPFAILKQPSHQVEQLANQIQQTSVLDKEEEVREKHEQPLLPRGSTSPTPMAHSGVVPHSRPWGAEDQACVGCSSTPPLSQPKKAPPPPLKVKPPHLKRSVSLHQPNSDATRSGSCACDSGVMIKPGGRDTAAKTKMEANTLNTTLEPETSKETALPTNLMLPVATQVVTSQVAKIIQKLEGEKDKAKIQLPFTACLPPATSLMPVRSLTLRPTITFSKMTSQQVNNTQPPPTSLKPNHCLTLSPNVIFSKMSPRTDEDNKWEYYYLRMPSTIPLKNKPLPPKNIKLRCSVSLSPCHHPVIPPKTSISSQEQTVT